MPYIGNTPAEKYAAFDVQHFTTSATTGYTLTHAVANENDIRLVINNVVQQPGSSYAYTASGTTLTLSSATSGTDTMYCVFLGKAVQTVNPAAGSVGTSQLADDAVTTIKINDDAVNSAKLSSTAVDNTNTNSTLITAQTAKTSLVDADKFLISDSAASGALKYVEKQYLPSGGLVPIRQSSGSSNTTNVIVNGWITDTYENYVMDYYFNVATNNEAISMTLYDSSGNISSGNEYDWTHIGSQATDGAKVELYNTGQNAFRLCHGANNDSARVSVTGRLTWLHPRASGKRTTILHHQRQLNNSANVQSFIGALEFKAANALTGFYCNSTSGDISGWDINIYGIVNS